MILKLGVLTMTENDEVDLYSESFNPHKKKVKMKFYIIIYGEIKILMK